MNDIDMYFLVSSAKNLYMLLKDNPDLFNDKYTKFLKVFNVLQEIYPFKLCMGVLQI